MTTVSAASGPASAARAVRVCPAVEASRARPRSDTATGQTHQGPDEIDAGVGEKNQAIEELDRQDVAVRSPPRNIVRSRSSLKDSSAASSTRRATSISF